MKSIQRVLIFRPDNIGDVMLFSGALKHIRNIYPDAYITLAVQDHIVNLMELCPHIDKCISLKDLNWWYRIEKAAIPYISILKSIVRRSDRYWNMITKLFDLVIFPVKSPQAQHIEMVSDLGVRKIYGIAGCTLNAPAGGYSEKIDPKILFSNYLDVSKDDPWRHEFFTTLDFLKFLGCGVSDINDIKPEMWVSDSDKNLLENERTNSRKIIGLFPGGSFKDKCWCPENYEVLARLLSNSLTYVIFGGLEDTSIANKVESFLRKVRSDIEVISLVGKTTLRDLYKTISACNLVLSMDTSGLHMAITAGVPTIGIVGGAHYGRFIPWGNPERHIFMTKKMECFYCNWNCIKDTFECIHGVSPEGVADNVNKLLRLH